MRTFTAESIYTLAFLILSLSLIGQGMVDSRTLEERIDNYLNNGVINGFSGSILVAKQGDIVIHKGYGMANKENLTPYTSTTVSTVGSVTKQFTATAIMKLVELNKLKVEDPLSTFFPKIPSDKQAITLHQLLTHSSGFVHSVGDGDFEQVSTKAFFKTLFATELLHSPGAVHNYSNAGYSILARVIEIASGQDYESFLNEHLFEPAGMTQTGYLIPEWDTHSIASGYASNIVHVGTLISRFQDSGNVAWALKGNGGIQSTTGDMFKWRNALKENQILSQASFDKLTSPYMLEQDGGSSHYAYGWAIYTSDRNTKIISHNGGNHIFFHEFIWSLEEDVVVILFTNANSKQVEVTWPIHEMVFDKDYKPKPIKKNLLQFTFDHISQNEMAGSDEFTEIIKKEYGQEIKSPSALNGLGYKILRNEMLELKESAKWAIAIFKLNTELFPNEGNVWDSLGEGYAKNDQIEEAVMSYKMALELAPDKNCDWCKSSTKALNTLRKN